MIEKTTILSTKDLSIGYRNGKQVSIILENINLTLYRGELVCLIGSNGIGKSTLLRTLSGVQNPLKGNIKIGHADISQYSRSELSRLIGIVYTDRTLAGALTVEELVSLGRQPYTGFFDRLDKEDKKIVSSVLDDVGMSHKSQCYIATLSDGERQKIMIAKALAQHTPIVLLDEPTAFLDVASNLETMQLLHSLAHKHNKAILLSTHDISQSITLADRLWLLFNDKTITSGITEDLILNGDLDKLFTGRNISFNYLQGNFYSNTDYSKYVSIDSNDARLRRWITNALNRNDIGISIDSPNKITVISPSEIKLNQTTFYSITSFIEDAIPLIN